MDAGYERSNELKLSLASQETLVACQTSTQVASIDTNSVPVSSTSPPSYQPLASTSKPENRYGRINPKSVQAINSGE